MGSEADRFNLAEIRATALGSLGGGQPKPIRKRGYHRALKARKQWALTQKSWNDLINKNVADLYVPTMTAYTLTENPFLKMAGLSQWLPNEKYTVKIEYGSYFGLDRDKAPHRFSAEYKPLQTLWSRIKSWWRND